MKQVDKKVLTLRVVSEELGLSLRHIKRIRKRYLKQGEKGLISLKCGQESNRKFSQQFRGKVMRLIKDKYVDFGPTLATEKLYEINDITLSAEMLRKWLIEEGIWKPKRRKEVKIYQRRSRRNRFGQLLQGDRSPHDWFESQREKCIRPRCCAELLRAARLGIGWRVSHAKFQTFAVTGEGDISKLDKQVTFLFCVDRGSFIIVRTFSKKIVKIKLLIIMLPDNIILSYLKSDCYS